MPQTRAHVTVRGSVQGVGFRWYTRRQASSLRLGGWVRNLPDGSVEAVFEGEEHAVRSMVAWCRSGPSSSDVREIDVEWLEPTGTAEAFEITF